MTISRRQAVIELSFAAWLWGFSFIAARWALEGFGPFWVCALRFILGFVLAIYFLSLEKKKHGGFAGAARLSLIPGILLGVTLLLQTRGLQLTTVTKSSFLSNLYVVFVPLFDWMFFKKRVGWLMLLWMAVALWGAALITRFDYGAWNYGDVLTFLCAITAAWQILYIEKVASKISRPFSFNAFQTMYAGILSLPFALAFESFTVPSAPLPWIGVVFLAVGVCLISFTVQVRAQKVLSSVSVTMFFLIESPIATLFAWILFQEVLGWDQIFGGALILLAALGTLKVRS